MKTRERIQMVEDALDQIREAQELLTEALYGTDHWSHFEGYGQYGINQLLGNGNPYDRSLEDIVESLREQHQEEREAKLTE